MERHQWREDGEEGLRYFRAVHHGGRWTISSRLKDEEEWTPHHPIEPDLWRTLRELLWRKYQRKRCPGKQIEQLDKIIEDGAGEDGR